MNLGGFQQADDDGNPVARPGADLVVEPVPRPRPRCDGDAAGAGKVDPVQARHGADPRKVARTGEAISGLRAAGHNWAPMTAGGLWAILRP